MVTVHSGDERGGGGAVCPKHHLRIWAKLPALGVLQRTWRGGISDLHIIALSQSLESMILLQGGDWREAFDGLRGATPSLWQSLAPAEKQIAVKKGEPDFRLASPPLLPSSHVCISPLRWSWCLSWGTINIRIHTNSRGRQSSNLPQQSSGDGCNAESAKTLC